MRPFLTADSRRARRCRGLAVFAARLTAAVALGLAARSNGRAEGAPVGLRIDASSPGTAIPPDFSGLSYELTAILPAADGGRYFRPDATRLITLFRTLGIANLRIGGNTSDRNFRRAPSAEDLASLFGFARAAGVKVIYCLRLHGGDPAADAAEAKSMLDRYGSLVDAFSIGQEPSAYPVGQVETRPPGERMGGAAEKYPYAEYRAAWARFDRAILAAAPGARICGPSVHNNAAWTREFIADFGRGHGVAFVTAHLYPGGAAGKLPSAEAGRDRMLSGQLTRVAERLWAGFAPEARAAGLPYRLEEVNSYFNGGARGASDAFAASLWGLDFMHWWAAHGAAGLNIHTGDRVSMNGELQAPRYAVFSSGPDGFQIRPLAYALKAFALGSDGAEVPVAVDNPAGINLTAYAVRLRNGGLAVTVINREHGPGARKAALAVAAGAGWGRARVVRLEAPGGDVKATSGIVLGSGPIDREGRWTGSWEPLALQPGQALAVEVPAASAAVIRLDR
jgi:hypothetical protein